MSAARSLSICSRMSAWRSSSNSSKRIGRDLVIQRRDNLRALVVREVFDDVGDLRRMQTRESVVGDFEAHVGRIGGEILDVRPVHQIIGGRALAVTAKEAGEQGTRPDIDPDHPIRALDGSDLQVIDAHDPLAIHVDDLAVEDIPAEQDLVLPAVERGEVELVRREGRAVRRQSRRPGRSGRRTRAVPAGRRAR